MARVKKKDELRQTIIDGTAHPLRTANILERLKEQDPRIGETEGSEADTEGVSQTVEDEEEVWPPSDRVCDNRGKCYVSSQVERGADGEFEISYPYDIRFPRAMKNISGTKLDVCSIYAGLKSGVARLENLIPIQSIKRRWYDKWKREFYLSVFQYPEKEECFSFATKATQTGEVLKSCLVKVVQDTNDTKQNESESASEVTPDPVKCTCDETIETPEEINKTLNVTCVASQQSLHTSLRASNIATDQIVKAISVPITQPTSISSAIPKSSDSISIDKELAKIDSLTLVKSVKRSTGKLWKISKKYWTPTSSAPSNTTSIIETQAHPQKAVSLDAGPKVVKRDLSRISKQTAEANKEVKDTISKPNDEAVQGERVKGILKSSTLTGNASKHELESESRDESSREQIIREILFEPQTFPEDTKPKASSSSNERENEDKLSEKPVETTEEKVVDSVKMQ